MHYNEITRSENHRKDALLQDSEQNTLDGIEKMM